MVTGGSDGKVFLWDVRRAKSRLKCLDYNDIYSKRHKEKTENRDPKSHDGPITSLRFTSDGLNLLSLGKDKRLRKWCLDTGCNLKAKFPLIPHKSSFCTVGYELISIPSEDGVYLINVNDFSVVKRLVGHADEVKCCVYNECFQEIYSAGMDMNIVIYEANQEMAKAYQSEVRASQGYLNGDQS